MQFFKSTNYNFIGNRIRAFVFSGTLITISLISIIVHRGFNLSIDFAGGTVIELKFQKPVFDDISKVRALISSLDFGQPEVKTIGPKDAGELQIIVKKKEEGTAVGDGIRAILEKEYADNPFELRREEKVGPKIGSELQEAAIVAILLSLLVILIYVGVRFHLPFGVGAVVALFHDVIITLGVFSIINAEISLPVIAALLFIVGYSLNDTIVVFDRIRENLGGSANKKSFDEKVNYSINQTLSRTIITSVTTLFAVISILAFFINTGDVLKFFAGALLIGILVGTYSSVFIASPVLVLWNKKWPIK